MFCHSKPLFRARSEGLGRLAHSVYKVKFVRSFVRPQLFLRLNGLFKVTTLFRCFEALKLPQMCMFRTFQTFAQKINYWKLKLFLLEVVYQKELNVLGENKEK